MATITATQRTSFAIAQGESVTVVASSIGTGIVQIVVDGTEYSRTAMAAGETKVFADFERNVTIVIECSAGALTYTQGAQTGRQQVEWLDSSGSALVRPDGTSVGVSIASVRDSSSRTTYAGGSSIDQSAISGAIKTVPVLVRTSNGVAKYAQDMQGALGYGGKLVAVNTAGTFYKWTATTGWEIASSVGVIAGTVNVFFCDSRSSLFYAPSTGAVLYRSLDDGATWAASLTLPGSTDTVAPMCEDDHGGLYVGAYGTTSGASTGYNTNLAANSRKVYKSTDGGATWAEISTAFPVNGGGYSGPAGVHRHIHGCWWDNSRKLLFITHGDGGSGSKIYVSDDYGTTFSVWSTSAQATAMGFTSSHVLYASDTAADRRVYRCACAGMAGLLTGTPSVCWDWVADGGQPDNGSTTNGYAWQGITDNQGNVVFPFGTEGTRTSILATSDSGSTWAEVASGAAAGRQCLDQVQVSPFNTTRDGWQYQVDTVPATDTMSAWRVYAPNSVLSVSYATPFVPGDGVGLPLRELIDSGQQSIGVVQKLAASYPVPAVVTMPYALVHSGGYAFGPRSTVAPKLVENWDSVTAPAIPSGYTLSTSGTGTAAVTSTTQKVSGANALKCVLGAGAAGSEIRLTTAPWTVAAGDVVWCAASYWIDAIGATRTDLIEFNSIRVGVITRDGVKRIEVTNTTIAFNARQALAETIACPESAWVRIKAAITVAPNTGGAKSGRVQVWQDTGSGYRLVIDVIGIPTYGSLAQNIFVGALSTGNACTVYVDDWRLGLNADPERPPALSLTGTQQGAIDMGIFR